MGLDKRELVAQIFSVSGITGVAGFFLNNPRLRGSFLRAVNYHGTPIAFRDQLRRHLEYYRRNFKLLCEDDLPDFTTGKVYSERPYLLMTFDDGLKTNYTVASPLLDEFGIKGIFFLPVSFIDQAQSSADKQREFYKAIGGGKESNLSAEEYQPMSWKEVRDLVSRGHAIGSHTLTHCSLRQGLDKEKLEREIIYSKRVLEERSQKKIISFCWTYGMVVDYSKSAYELVCKHYDFAFTTFASPFGPSGNPYAIDRSNVEAFMSIARVKCATQGITELYFLNRRKYFEALVSKEDKSV
jgi:peptidoglycan/xylan/chitin deacetylase (PgdA/CDA1 family)